MDPNVMDVLPPRSVLVLDISHSMSLYGRLQNLQLSAMRHLNDIPDNSYVGIVWFCEMAQTEHEVVKITDHTVRQSLINKLPQRTKSGTDIGSGILEGLCALKRTGLSTENATIVLVTDGEHCASDPVFGHNYVAKVLTQISLAKVRIICIAIGNKADQNLEVLTKATNGSIHVSSPLTRGITSREKVSGMRALRGGLSSDSPNIDFESSPRLTSLNVSQLLSSPLSEEISVCNELLAINSGLNLMPVTIDRDIGRNTSFTIESDSIDHFVVSLTAPSGKTYDFAPSHGLKRFKETLNYTESGVWTLRLVSNSKDALFANVMVLSQPLGVSQIFVQLSVQIEEASNESPALIIAKLTRGTKVVIEAEVTATVDRPDGTQVKVKLVNYNNIYCNFFTEYCGSGRYNVSVLAKSDGNLTLLKDKSSGISERAHPFQRQLMVGSFKHNPKRLPKQFSPEILQEMALSKSLKDLTLDCVQSSQPFASFAQSKQPLIPNTILDIPEPNKPVRPGIPNLVKGIRRFIQASTPKRNLDIVESIVPPSDPLSLETPPNTPKIARMGSPILSSLNPSMDCDESEQKVEMTRSDSGESFSIVNESDLGDN